MAWCRQATSHYLDQCLAKFVCHYLRANDLIYSQTVAELIDFCLVVCMASNLIFRKQRYSGRRRSYIYPTWQCRIAIWSTLIRGLCRQSYSFALATDPGRLSRRFVLLICLLLVCYARAWLRCSECYNRVTVTQNNARTVASWYI